MIVGNGLIASSFEKHSKDLDDFVVFASGVSNSSLNDVEGYERELKLVSKTISENSSKKIIYFSSIFVDNSSKPYYQHKKNVEEYIKEHSRNFLIFRIPQLIGTRGNSNNLFNFLKTSILKNDPIKTNEKIERSFLDVDDLVDIVLECKENTGTLNIAYIEKISVVNICNIIGKCLDIKPNIVLDNSLNFEDCLLENDSVISDAFDKLNIKSKGYNKKVIEKYI